MYCRSRNARRNHPRASDGSHRCEGTEAGIADSTDNDFCADKLIEITRISGFDMVSVYRAIKSKARESSKTSEAGMMEPTMEAGAERSDRWARRFRIPGALHQLFTCLHSGSSCSDLGAKVQLV